MSNGRGAVRRPCHVSKPSRFETRRGDRRQTGVVDGRPLSIQRRPGTEPLVIAHRGASVAAPPNTLAAFAAAADAGADLVELDVLGSLRVGHSEAEVTAEAPSLDEALALLAQLGLGAHVDMKVQGIERAVVAALARNGLLERALISTTWTPSLRRLAHAAPDLPRAIGYPRDRLSVSRFSWPRPITRGGAALLRSVMPVRLPALAAYAKADILALHHTLVSRAAVEAAHRRRIAVFVWTVNDPDEARRFDAFGVDAIVTDDPAGIRAAIREQLLLHR